MCYTKPVISLVNPRVTTQNQYVANITNVTINPEGCYEFTQDGEVPPGNYSFAAQGTAEAGPCLINFSIGGSAVVTDTAIIACDVADLNCTINQNCTGAPHTDGDVCVNSATLNGVEQGGLPECGTVGSALMDQLINEALTTCVSN